jgi:transposase
VWRSSEDLPPASRSIGSLYDEEAHYSKKRKTQWVGYKVHLTETCERDLPLLMTHVETTSAPISDDTTLPTIHAELDRKALLPAEHLVDTGYVDAQLLVESQRDYQVDLVGPTRKDYRWQAKQQKGFDASHFLIDWDQHQATCPEGHTSISWSPTRDKWQNEDKDDSCRSVTETSMIFIIPIPPMAGTFGEEVLKLSRAPVCLPSSQRPSGTVGVT